MWTKANYEELAERYDQNEDRLRIARDEALGALLEARRVEGPLTVLDLGCGTGNYLAEQGGRFAGAPVRWLGVDPSAAMLERAMRKVPGAELMLGKAESLPIGTAEVDYVVVRFALHHVEDKPRALDEIARVLRPDGTLRITDIAPSYMPGWWLYRFFPSAWPVDQTRFWPPQRIFHELEERGFRPMLHVDYRLSHVSIRAVLADAERREISELAIVDDQAYASGLAAIRRRAETNPSEASTSELAIADLIAPRGGSIAATRWP